MKVLTNVRDSGRIVAMFFLSYDDRVFDLGFGNYERVSEVSAVKKLLPVKILAKVLYTVNLPDKGHLLNARTLEEGGIMFHKLINRGLVKAIFKLSSRLSN